MTILFAANSAAAFTTLNDGSITTDTTAGRFDSAYVPCGVSIDHPGEATLTLPSAVAEFWFHCEFFVTNTTQANFVQFVEFYSGAQRVIYPRLSSGLFDSVRLYNGGTDAVLTSFTGVSIPVNARHIFDFHYKFHDTLGVMEMYFDGVLVASFSGDTILSASWATINKIKLRAASGSASSRAIVYSQIVVADTDTRNMRLFSSTLTAAGTTNTFDAGAYTDVDEEGKYNDADYLQSATADQIFLAATEDLPTGKIPIAVAVNARALEGGVGAPANINMALRSGGTNYYSSDIALGTAFGPVYNVWNTDPNTAAAWTESGFNSLEAGVRSRT